MPPLPAGADTWAPATVMSMWRVHVPRDDFAVPVSVMCRVFFTRGAVNDAWATAPLRTLVVPFHRKRHVTELEESAPLTDPRATKVSPGLSACRLTLRSQPVSGYADATGAVPRTRSAAPSAAMQSVASFDMSPPSQFVGRTPERRTP